jgi:type III secretion protein V
MRFVKGDAVAALVIVGINLVGGMAIGVGARGLPAAEAARTYSLLSIGSGLLAQIPSLLVAVAAGLLVTRVASTGDRPLGEDLGEQIGADPRALGGAAVLLAALALMPGLPLAPFLLLAAVAGAAAMAAARRRRRLATTAAATLDEPGAAQARGPRLSLRLPPAVYARFAARPGELHARLAGVRARAAEASGVPVPPLAVAADRALGEREAALAIDGTPAAWLELPELQALDASAADEAGARADAADASTRDPFTVRLGAALRPLLPELLGVDRVAAMVEQTAADAPALVREVVPRLVSLPVLAEVLRGLVREELPVGDLAAVLEAIALAPAPPGGHTAQGAPALIEQLRGRLRRQIAARWAPRGRLAVYTVDAMIEDAVRGAIDRSGDAAVLALEPAIAQDIVAAVRSKLGAGPAVILTSGDVRPHLRGLLEPELPAIAVLAAHELAPGVAIEAAGRIEVA